MTTKIFNTPILHISEVKRSPMDVFKKAAEEGKGVYIFNRKDIAGVMLTQKQYESVIAEVDCLYDQIAKLTTENRLLIKESVAYSDSDVRGSITNELPVIDESDGWK